MVKMFKNLYSTNDIPLCMTVSEENKMWVFWQQSPDFMEKKIKTLSSTFTASFKRSKASLTMSTILDTSFAFRSSHYP